MVGALSARHACLRGEIMILAFSARMFEQRTRYDLELEDMASLASQIGYQAMELRRRQLTESASPAEIAAIRDTLRRHGIECAYLTAAGLENRSALDDATRLLAVALALDSHLVRVQLLHEEEIPLAQEFADRAAERGLRVMSQLHTGTLFANVDQALETLSKIGRDNFGVAFEASHLMFDHQHEHGEGAVRRLGDRLYGCFLQAYKPAPRDDESPDIIIIGGDPWLPALPGEEGSADIPSVFRGLKAIGFDGLAVVMCPRHPEVESRDLARLWHDYVRRVMAEVSLS